MPLILNVCRLELFHDATKSKERVITATKNHSDNTRTSRTIITRKQKWEEKQLYGYFMRQTCKISPEKTWTWLEKEILKKGTKSLLTVQDNAIRTNYIKAN